MKPQPEAAWCIVGSHGFIVTTTSWRRCDAIEKIRKIYGPRHTWRQLYRRGFRAVKVFVIASTLID